MKLTHPGSEVVVETTADLARPYLSQGWVEKKATPRRRAAKRRKSADRAGSMSGTAAPTTKKENSDGD